MYHTIIIAGNLGRDPEMRYTPSGQAVTSFPVATNRQYTASNGETVKETIWFRVSVWGKMAEVTSQYLKKGSKVLVEGRLNADPATGGPRLWGEGEKKASFEVTAQTVRFLSNKGEDGTKAGTPAQAQPAEYYGVPDDDIPF